MPTPDLGLTASEASLFRRLAGLMIPPDEARDMPGADDPVIFADILASLGRDADAVRGALAALADAGFADLDEAQAEALALAMLARNDRPAAALGRAVLQCYYRDDRVLTALGLEACAPYPQGNQIDQGDWSLLDAVRHRKQLWRDDRRA